MTPELYVVVSACAHPTLPSFAEFFGMPSPTSVTQSELLVAEVLLEVVQVDISAAGEVSE